MKIQFGNIRRGKVYEIDTEKAPVVLASIGMNNDRESMRDEILKAQVAKKYGAFAVIDHTLTTQYQELQEKIITSVDIPLCAIAVYEMAVEQDRRKTYFDKSDVTRQFEKMAKRGVDLITVHASVEYGDLDNFHKMDRVISCTSRGGTIVMKNMLKSRKENPYLEAFDNLLDIAKKHNVGISLGSIYRPASVIDAMENNKLYYMEVKRNARLVQKAIDKSVAIMVEGYGHVPVYLIPEMTKKSIEVIHNAPLRVLPVATDSALGFDHLASAIAVSSATQHGASVVTAVSRSEHLGRPTVEDVKEAVISAKIAAYTGYSSRKMDFTLDLAMSKERSRFGCVGAVSCSIVPEMTKEALRKEKFATKQCTMCGDYCALDAADAVMEKANEN